MRVLRRGKGRREPLSDVMRFHLLTGQYPEPKQFDTWAEPWLLHTASKRALWLAHRDELLAEWTRDHPGSRPDAFWQFDAEESRRVIEHAELLMPVRPDSTDWEFVWREAFGVPCFQQCRPRGFEGYPTVEAEAVYLDRLGLLTDDERARIGPEDVEPEAVNPFLIAEGDLEVMLAKGDARRRSRR